MDELSAVVPLLARVYPNGASDVNHFQAAGGLGFVVRELLDAGLAHRDIPTVFGEDLGAYTREPWLDGEELAWREVGEAGDDTILRPVANPFMPDGGMRLVEGNLGRGTFKTSAVEPERWTIEAPCRVFERQEDVIQAFAAGDLDRDVVVVVRFQGPRANGMPELHKLTPPLGVLQDRGHKVALVTDGRMSGASGKVPAAIHVSPEALADGPLAYLRDGDMVKLCGNRGKLSTSADLSGREPATMREAESGTARELFAMFRLGADDAEKGASAMLAMGAL
jgi:phosphogluconate dehydratase